MKGRVGVRGICLSILFVMVFVVSGLSSNSKKWGKVDKKYLDMQVYPEDTSAVAVKIFDVGEIELWVKSSVEMYFYKQYQVKVLKETGKSYADIAIPYYYKDKVLKINAQTIQPNGKKVKLKGKEIHDEESKNNYKVKKFTLPSVQVGSIIEVEYKIHSQYFTHLEPWVFQSELPTLESLVTLKMSTGFIFNSNIYNDPLQRVQMSTDMYMNMDEKRRLKMFKWYASDLPAVKSEPYISSLSNYMARLEFQFSAYKYGG